MLLYPRKIHEKRDCHRFLEILSCTYMYMQIGSMNKCAGVKLVACSKLEGTAFKVPPPPPPPPHTHTHSHTDLHFSSAMSSTQASSIGFPLILTPPITNSCGASVPPNKGPQIQVAEWSARPPQGPTSIRLNQDCVRAESERII